MESKIEKPKEKRYPRLMVNRCENFIVLFSRDQVGTVVNIEHSSIHSIGDYSEKWLMSEFIDFFHTVVLSNQ